MRIHAFILVGVIASLTTNCTSRQEAAPSPELLVHAHFAGADQVSAAFQETKLKAIAALPETRALWNHVLGRLSRAPSVLSGGSLPPDAVDQAAPLLRVMLQDLWRSEFSVTLQRVGDLPLDYALALRIAPERQVVWRTNLMTLAAHWRLGNIRQGLAGGLPTMEIGDTNAAVRLRWVETAEWGLLGIGAPALPGLAAQLQATAQNRRPAPPLRDDAWLTLDLNLPALAPFLHLNPSAPWPRVDFALKGDGENLRSFGRLDFPKDMTGPLESWHIPTNLITEPLISFSAARGVAPLLAESKLVQALGLEPTPNRCFTWSQQSQLGQTFITFPMPDLANHLPQLAQAAKELLPPLLRTNTSSVIYHNTTNHSLTWGGVIPMAVPSLRAVQTPQGEFAFGSLFPPSLLAPPPQALLDQLNTTNLVLYNWEFTQPRIDQTLMLAQLAAVALQTPQLSSRQPALPWLQAAAPHLGNSATEVLAESPRVWRFNRKSQVGFTAPELILLVRWIDSVNFPKPGLRLPAEPSGSQPRRSSPPGIPGRR